MSKKSRRNKRQSAKPITVAQERADGLPPARRKSKFKNFAELAAYAKGLVYLIVRIREVDGETYYQNLGTSFLIGKQRMMTCYHCINSDDSGKLSKHEDGDLYMFVQKDEYGAFHRFGMKASEGSELFLYPEIDTAIFHLEEDFYRVNGEYYKHPEIYLELGNEALGIGAEIAILGYPFPNLVFDEAGNPNLDAVRIRGDQGVVNTAYVAQGIHIYEFTTAFNPGNSGGPIFDIKNGTVIAMVHGYNPMPLHCVEDTLPAGTNGSTEEQTHMSVLHTTYSIGISVQNFNELVAEHELAVR